MCWKALEGPDQEERGEKEDRKWHDFYFYTSPQQAVHEKSVLIAMNKSDISDQTGVVTLKSIMRMDDILQKSQCR